MPASANASPDLSCDRSVRDPFTSRSGPGHQRRLFHRPLTEADLVLRARALAEESVDPSSSILRGLNRVRAHWAGLAAGTRDNLADFTEAELAVLLRFFQRARDTTATEITHLRTAAAGTHSSRERARGPGRYTRNGLVTGWYLRRTLAGGGIACRAGGTAERRAGRIRRGASGRRRVLRRRALVRWQARAACREPGLDGFCSAWTCPGARNGMPSTSVRFLSRRPATGGADTGVRHTCTRRVRSSSRVRWSASCR